MASRVFSLFVKMKAWKVIATSQNKKKRDLMEQSIGESLKYTSPPTVTYTVFIQCVMFKDVEISET